MIAEAVRHKQVFELGIEAREPRSLRRTHELGFRLLGESNVVLEMAMTRRLRVVRFVQSVLRVLAHCLEHRIASRVRVDAMRRYERLVDQFGEWVQDRILVPLSTGNTCRRLERPATGKHRDSAQ